MTIVFDDRERATEAIFAREEEQRFLSRRAAVAALATWGAEGMGLDEAGRTAYVAGLMSRFLQGTSADVLLLRVRSDLERAGKPALSTNADHVLAVAEADASSRLHGRDARPEQAPAAQAAPHGRNAFWGWTV